MLTANVTTTLTCGNDTDTFNCGYVGQPTVRGSVQILVTFLFPMVSTAFGTLFMAASLKWWKKALDFLLRLFFPELSLWKIVKEEIVRTRYLNHLHSVGLTGATRQQLMSVQQGKLFVTGVAMNQNYELLDRNFGIKIDPVVDQREMAAPDGAIRWCSEKPEGCSQLSIENVGVYQHILASLPTGKQTWKGIGQPDMGTVLLTLQLIWLLIAIVMRLASGFRVSLLELYCLFSLVAFVAERLITQFNVPAWSQSVVLRMHSGFERMDIMDENSLPSTLKSWLLALPVLQFLGWPVFMFLYATKYKDGQDGLSMTNSVCLAAGGTYASAFIWAFIGSCVAGSSWRVLRYIPFGIACGAFCLSKVLIFGLGIAQTFAGERDIFLTPAKQWSIPHLSG